VSAQAWSQDDVAQRVRFGSGTLGDLGVMLRELGLRRVVLITSAGRAASDDGRRLAGLAGRALASTFAGVEPHLPVEAVRSAQEAVQLEGADGIVTFGGGAVIDCGKAVAFFTEQQAGVPGRSVLDRPALVHVAVPTTYSPGVLSGEFTMTDPHTRTKGRAGSPTCAPSAVVFDPDLTADLGPATIAGTGMDALAAAIEGVRRPAGAEAAVLAMAAAPRIAGVLPLVVDAPSEDVFRADLLESAALAARVLQRTGPGPHQIVTQLLGGRTGAPHGVVSAMLLPHTLGRATGPAMDRLADASSTDDLVAMAAELVERLGLPSRLAELGVEHADVDAVARLSQALQPATEWDEDTVVEVLTAAL
jgi:alcohol dehydrogenase class IV